MNSLRLFARAMGFVNRRSLEKRSASRHMFIKPRPTKPPVALTETRTRFASPGYVRETLDYTRPAAAKVFCNSIVIVIGPTPPGTGVR